jgi:hypothetical protein
MAAELHQEGLEYLLSLVTAGNLSIGLATDSSLDEDANIASITEVEGDGYERQTVTSLTPAATGTNDRKATTNTVTFTASGTWTTARTVFIVTSTNKLLASVPLSVVRTLISGDILTVAVEIDLAG